MADGGYCHVEISDRLRVHPEHVMVDGWFPREQALDEIAARECWAAQQA